MAGLRSLETAIKTKDLELVVVLPGEQNSVGEFIEATITALTTAGKQLDFTLTASDLKKKNKSRLRTLYRILRKNGILLIDDYGLIAPSSATDSPDAPGMPEAA